MVKPLPRSDFRAARKVIEPKDSKDLGLSPRAEPAPSDRTDEETWDSIVLFPDDAAVRCSSHNGRMLGQHLTLWNVWVNAIQDPDVSIADGSPLLWDAADEFQACTFNSLCGYYRLAISALRNILELSCAAALLSLDPQAPPIADYWDRDEVKFGEICSELQAARAVINLEGHLAKTTQDNILTRNPKGWVRRLYAELCRYSHSRPSYTTFMLWNKRRPIYARGSLLRTHKLLIETYCLCCILWGLWYPGPLGRGAPLGELVRTLLRPRWKWGKTARCALAWLRANVPAKS